MLSPEQKKLKSAVKIITGFSPSGLDVYELALQHSSAAPNDNLGGRESNERLEFLGDAVLGTVVAEYLFKKFPYKDEGFLTETRSRIVSRESLNDISRKIGVSQIIVYNEKKIGKKVPKSMFGDALEAFIGAVFLDQGFKVAQSFIIEKIIIPNFDFAQILSTTVNFKSKIIEWAQKKNVPIEFGVEIIGEEDHRHEFRACVIFDGKSISEGIAASKKKAEQTAARKACEKFELL